MMPPRTRIPPAGTIESIAFSIASAEAIRSRSKGELENGELVDHRELKPVEGGLFCRKIFGPEQNVACDCGSFKGRDHLGKICGCGSPVVDQRAKRMGHIELAAPVAHIWFYKPAPNYLALALGVLPKDLKKLMAFEAQVVVEPMTTGMQVGRILSPAALLKARNTFGLAGFRARGGCEGIREALVQMDIASEVARLKPLIEMEKRTAKARREARRFMLLSSFLASGFRPESMLLQVLPVQPAGLRDYQLSFKEPVSKKAKGKWVARIPDVNYLYQRVIQINARVQKSMDSKAGEDDLQADKRRLQESVDRLLDNARTSRPMENRVWQSDKDRWKARCNKAKTKNEKEKSKLADDPQFMAWYDSGNTSSGPAVKLVSLTDSLVGKEGRFRGNLLGKRVKFSARTVIVPGPELQLHQCGVPMVMALGLFQSFIVGELTRSGGYLLGADPEIDYPVAIHELKALVKQGHRHAVTALRRMMGAANPAFAEVWSCVITDDYKKAVEVLAASLQRTRPSRLARAEKMVTEKHPMAVEALVNILKRGHPVLLNRQPTLHRHSIQAFEPVLIDGEAIQLHPLVCSAYNADFDGDTVAIHVPISIEAQREARMLMMANSNQSSMANGKLMLTPTQDIVLGCYYLTSTSVDDDSVLESLPLFGTSAEVRLAYDCQRLRITDPIRFANPDRGRLTLHGDSKAKILRTTVGQVLFNEVFVRAFGFVDKPVRKARLYQLIDQYREQFGPGAGTELLELIKELGFRAATKAGTSIGMTDILTPTGVAGAIRSAVEQEEELARHRGTPENQDLMMRPEVATIWQACTKQVKAMVKGTLRLDNRRGIQNPLWTTLDSEARGNLEQVAQLCGTRGLITRHDGTIFKRPVCSNFRNGLNMHEMFISTIGARKGQIDSALRTAQAGFFTRLLIHLAHDLIVTEEDCGTLDGIRMAALPALAAEDETARSLASRVAGRIAAEEVVCGSERLRAGEEVTRALATLIEKAGVHFIKVRSVLTCKSRKGVCVACYGRNLATGQLPTAGDTVGIMAAQSLGEPATQLTLRTFHLGGVATQLSEAGEAASHETSLRPVDSEQRPQQAQQSLRGEDITTSLPALQRLFTIRAEGDNGLVARISGLVSIVSHGQRERCIWVTDPRSSRREDHWFPQTARMLVAEGQQVSKGERLVEDLPRGSDLLLGDYPLQKGQQALIDRAQRLYMANKIEINERHFEVIVRQMCRAVRVQESGDTSLQQGSRVERSHFEAENDRVVAAGGEQAVGKLELLGINRFTTDDASVLATAGFSDTVGALATAVVLKKVDRLAGLRENLMLGKLMPAGTGFLTDPQVEPKAAIPTPSTATEGIR